MGRWIVAARGLKRAALTASIVGAASMIGWAAPAHAEQRGLIIGVDDAAASSGAARDAAALAHAWQSHGGTDTVLLTDAQATRPAVLAALDRLAQRTVPGDVILLAFAGTGHRDEHPVPGTLAVDFVLGGDRAKPETELRLTGAELTRAIRALEAHGGRVILVADAAMGGLTPRRPPAAQEVRGAVPSIDGGLGGSPSSQPFGRSLVVAASDLRFGSDTALLPGQSRSGRLLTFAITRAITDGVVPLENDMALVSYAARVVYQLSDQRQQVAALFGTSDVDGAPARLTRGIVIKPTAALMAQPPRATADAPSPETPTALFPHAGESEIAGPVRIAAATGSREMLEKLLPPTTKVQAVTRNESPDLIWDPTFKNVLTPGGDLVADDVDSRDIPRIIDRTLALRQLKSMIVDAPQSVVLMPDDEVKLPGNIVKIVVGDAGGRSLILFDIRSDGKIRLLYPRPSDPPIITDPTYELSLRVNEPIGTDTIVVVTGTQRLSELEDQLGKLDGKKVPVAAIRLIHDTALPGTLVGSVSIFSSKP